jgi:small conductance mechanosensitive channel
MEDQLKTIDQVRQTAIALAIQFGPKVLVAIALMIVGVIVSQWVGRMSDRGLKRFHLEPPVRHLLVRAVHIIIIALFAIMALQNLGVELLPLIAGLGVAGAGVALAMQGVLGNIMAGLTIIFTKPFRVGEYISIANEEGMVETITLSNTILSHPDLSLVVIPNRKIVGEILHNYGRMRQLEIAVAVARDTDLNAALAAMADVVRDNTRCLRDPAPAIAVGDVTGGGITIVAKPWVGVGDYASVGGEIRKAVIEAFRACSVSAVPPAQREIRMVAERA